VREPPDVAVGDLIERAQSRFGIPVNEAEFLPFGNDSAAWAFRLASEHGTWFLKVVNRSVDAASLEVPRYLAEHGIEHLLAPIATAAGAPFDLGDTFSLIVYPFVDGEPGGEISLTTAQRTEFGRVVRRIHDTPVSEDLATIMRRERFVPPLVGLARTIGRQVLSGAFDDRFQRSFAAFWLGHQREIERILERAEALGVAARTSAADRVICHADIHTWNVLVEPSGDFVIVDWDETLLAPRERDLMFVDGGIGGLDNDGPAFFAGYGGIQIDPVLIAYYRFDWVAQELADYGRRVFLTPGLGDGTRAEAVDFLVGMFEPGQVVEAADRADAELGR
jgi:spectinomycin phosphotransferase